MKDMADQLYLSYRFRGFSPQNMLRHFEKALRLFPFSRLGRSPSVLRVNAVSPMEPPLCEYGFDAPIDIDGVLAAAKEFLAGDCAAALETQWDLWQYDADWKLSPARVIVACFGPEFDSGSDDHLRLDFGIDTHFLPQPELPNHLFMTRSNVRSLLHLVHELDRTFAAESRRLWSESGENFAQRLQTALIQAGDA